MSNVLSNKKKQPGRQKGIIKFMRSGKDDPRKGYKKNGGGSDAVSSASNI